MSNASHGVCQRWNSHLLEETKDFYRWHQKQVAKVVHCGENYSLVVEQEATRETMDEKNRILDLDREWNEAYPRLDCAALDRIIADDWVCIDGAGLVITKRELLTRVASSASFLDSYKFDEIALRIFGEVAILTGRLSGQIQESDGIHDINQRYMRVYVKRNERWQAVATQVTKIKETVLS